MMVDRCFFISFCFLPFVTLLVIPHLPFDSFNASRILEVGLICIYLVWVALRLAPIRFPSFSQYVQRLLAILIVIVLLSTVLADCVPLSVLGTLENFSILAVVMLLAGNRLGFEWCLKCCVVLNAVALGVYEFSVIIGYFAGLLGDSSISYEVLVYGVTNIRFFNQYQVWVTPLLFFAGVLVQWQRRVVARLIWLIVSFSWALLFFSSARGALFSLVMALVPFFVLGNQRIRKCAAHYLFCAIVGFLVFFVMYHLLPIMLVDGQAINVVRSGDSGRLALWGYSVDLWLSNLWVGAGTSNFATLASPWFFAHPHNILFQVLSEWGVAAALIVILLLSRYFSWIVSDLKSLGRAEALESDARSVALLLVGPGVVIYSMLDGVHIMPLSQMTGITILAVMVKHSMGDQPLAAMAGFKNVLIKVCVFLCVLFWLPVVAYSYSRIPDETEINVYPRFWIAGFLAENCCESSSITPPASTNPQPDSP